MAVLLLRTQDGSIRQMLAFTGDLPVGAAEGNAFRLSADFQVAPYHVVISRSSLFQVPVLIHLADEEGQTRVNGRQVVRFKALHHRDQIELGQARLEFWEVIVQKVFSGSSFVGQKCLFCYTDLLPGDWMIACPRCQSPHHRECWLQLSVCSYYGCGYPVQETLRRVLAPEVRFERLEEESELVKSKKICGAGNPRDQAPFRPYDWVAYCPGCATPFHAECWLSLQRCPICGYDVSGLISRVLDPAAAMESALSGRVP